MIYLDAQASTPLHPDVYTRMIEVLADTSSSYANPHSTHFAGQQAMKIVDDSRRIIAQSFGVEFQEVIFTSGATEGNNIVLQGVVTQALKEKDHIEIITSPIEHSAVIAVLEFLQQTYPDRITIKYLPLLQTGIVDSDKLSSLLTKDTVLVTVMHANNEIGTIQPMKHLATQVKNYRGEGKYPIFHSDGAQAVWSEDIMLGHTSVDAYTFSGHKIYGPKGVGAIILREGTPIQPLTYGGGQEYTIRPGTVSPFLVAGLAKSIEILSTEAHQQALKYTREQTQKIIYTLQRLPGVTLNGDLTQRLPHNIHITVLDKVAESLVIAFDLKGIALSAGSACHSGALEPSHVVLALGKTSKEALSSLRISVPQTITPSEVDEAIRIITHIITH